MALVASLRRILVAIQDRLQNGGHGSHPDTCGNQYCMFTVEDAGGRGVEGPVDVNDDGVVKLEDVF